MIQEWEVIGDHWWQKIDETLTVITGKILWRTRAQFADPSSGWFETINQKGHSGAHTASCIPGLLPTLTRPVNC